MSDLVNVGNYFDRISAEIAKSILDENGIESYVNADDAGGMRPALLTASGGAYLVVRAEDAAIATDLLESAQHEEDVSEDEASVA